jgi:carboxypeptidase Q
MQADGFDRVVSDTIMVPHWDRGNEYCRMVSPRSADMPMLGLGGSIGTPPEGITASVLVIRSFEELEKRSEEARGKIVVYHVPFENYHQCVKYRFVGAIKAAQAGAIASLTRSVSPVGMNNPHTGMMIYSDTVKKIPHAAILPEDAAMLFRMQQRGITPQVKLYMEARTLPDVESANLFCEIRGSEYPDEIIAVGGHIDCWDTGTGAHDDASGCIAAWEALRIIKESGLKPARTLRAVMWANEENGQRGGKEYARMHGDENHVLMFEFDSGVFPPSQIRYSGNEQMFSIVKSFEPLLQEINDSLKVVENAWGVDIRPMVEQFGVPSMCLNTDDKGKYFWYHHSPADTPDKIDPEEFNRCIAAIAVAVYLYSELPGSFINY